MNNLPLLDQGKKKLECPSLLQLSLSLIPDELTGDKLGELETHRNSCGHCEKRWQELKHDRETFYHHSPHLILPQQAVKQPWFKTWQPLLAGAFSLIVHIQNEQIG